jgi:hypothetical protein
MYEYVDIHKTSSMRCGQKVPRTHRSDLTAIVTFRVVSFGSYS